MVITSVKWAQEAHINWELNERISLSSAGSEPLTPAGSNSNNKSTNLSKVKIQNNLQLPTQDTPVQRRWNIASDKLERTNDALAQRLSVIEELNKKILANNDKMQHANGNGKKSRWRPKDTSFVAIDDRMIKAPKQIGNFVAEKRRVLGEKMNFERKAGGEWILPSEKSKNEQFCTLLRNNNGTRSPLPSIGPSATSSPISWTKEDEEEVEDSSNSSVAQESSVLRELNEAIDKFEEEEEDEEDKRCHDTSWDSGVGCEVSIIKTVKGTGWLRIYVGQESSLVYLTLETSAADVCRDMLLSEHLALFVQVSF